MISRLEGLALASAALGAGAIGVTGPSPWSLGLPALLFTALVTDGVFRPGSGSLQPIVTHGPREGNQVALSFDDGPDPEVTPAVLAALGDHGAHATFFNIGRHLAAQPLLARRLLAEGHELGNHSWCHSRWQSFAGSRAQTREIEAGARAITALTGSPAQPLYRPPMGIKSPPFARAAQQLGLTVVGWSLHSHDSRTTDPERISQRVLSRVRAGDIVLLHDGHDLYEQHRPACAQALPAILRGLRQQGLDCVTVSELLRLPRPSGVQAGSGGAPR